MRFALGVVEGDVVPAIVTPVGEVGEATLCLAEMELGGGGERSWTTMAVGLRDEHGPFRLAALEALVCVADWSGSDV